MTSLAVVAGIVAGAAGMHVALTLFPAALLPLQVAIPVVVVSMALAGICSAHADKV